MSHKFFHRFVSMFIAAVLSLAGFSPALAAPPSNDNFVDADVIPSLPFSATVDITEATNELSEPQPCHLLMDRTVWYSFTPTQNMWVRPDIYGSATSSIVNVYHSVAPGINNLNFLNCAESFGDSRIFYAEAGQQYYLQVGSIFGEVGNIQLNLDEVPPPANDNFADAQAINFLPGSGAIGLEIHTATNEMSEPENCFSMDKTVWFSFTPTQNMVVRMSAQGDGISSNVNVYLSVGPGINNLNFLQCATFGNSSTLFAEAGQKYYLQFGSIYGEVGHIALTLQGGLPPANDNFTSAEIIGSLPFNTTVDITDAGVETDEPQSCSYNERTVWYFFTPSESMTVRLDIQGSGIAALVGIYRAELPGITGLYNQQCADLYSYPVSNIPMEAGFTYYFQVGSISGAAGNVQVALERIPPPLNDNFGNATVIGALPFNDSVDSTGASRETGEPYDCYGSRYTVWYSFTAFADGVIRADMAGSNFSDTQLSVYTGTGQGFGDLSFVNCGYFGTPITLRVQAGTTYYFQAGSVAGGGGDLHVNLQEIPPPPNDNIANATSFSTLPFTIGFDTSAATFESNEPAACGYPSPPYKTIWFAFTASQDGYISASIPISNFAPFLAVYGGTDFNDLTQLGCGQYSNKVTFDAVQSQTYYIQVGGYYGEGGPGQFLLENAPAPEANFYFYPGDPSKYDTIQFCSSSYDPGNVGIESFTWDFGDGATATEGCSTHGYATDGDYTVQHTVTTVDGRTAASTPQIVQVRTHDVAITRITAPNSANSGQTKSITVTLRNKAYPETVQVDLYKSVPGGFVWVATVTKSVPALSGNRTTSLNFNYMFTSDDARIGKVTFRAVATIIGARDALPIDNEAISSPPTKVSR